MGTVIPVTTAFFTANILITSARATPISCFRVAHIWICVTTLHPHHLCVRQSYRGADCEFSKLFHSQFLFGLNNHTVSSAVSYSAPNGVVLQPLISYKIFFLLIAISVSRANSSSLYSLGSLCPFTSMVGVSINDVFLRQALCFSISDSTLGE